jgi:hypothetical protein
MYGSATVSVGNTFRDQLQLCETADNTDNYIYIYIVMVIRGGVS